MIYLVLGYGCHLNLDTRFYLETVSDHIIKESPTIVSGGFTNQKSAPGKSEAGIMKQFFQGNGFSDLVVEESSITTLENLENCKKIIVGSDKYRGKKIIIFCDSCRALKVWLMSLFIFGIPTPRIITVDVTRNWFKKMKQIFIATPLDLLAMAIPFVRKLQRQRKERIIKIS